MKKLNLEIIVFFCGATVMILELTASRILAPVAGTSTFVWTSIIGIILASLSIGYWWGGKLSDKKPNPKDLSKIIFYSALVTCIVSYFNPFILQIFSGFSSNVIVLAVFNTLILFAPPSILLGMVSPYAVRLRLEDVANSGETVGRLYALSTIGSICGTFLAGFVLIPILGSQKIITLSGLILLLLSVIAYQKDIINKLTLLIFLIGGLFLTARYEGLEDIDTRYSRIQVTDITDKETGKPARLLIANGQTQTMIYPNDVNVNCDYIEYLELYSFFKPQFTSALMLGGGGFALPISYIEKNQNATMDVVEIDPQTTNIAKKYFGLKENKRLNIIYQDARIFLNNNSRKYDIVFADVFNGKYTPFHLTTVESMRRINSSLTDDGLFMANIVASIEGVSSKYLKTQIKTIQSVFPQVYLLSVKEDYDGKISSNLIVVASKERNKLNFETSDIKIKSKINNLWTKNITTDLPILTDDFAPVEFYTLK